MNRGRQNGGYTIIETLIFIAISTALFVATMVAFSGRQGRTEFTQSARDFEVELKDIANDVATGYYSNVVNTSGNFLNCTAPGGTIVISNSATDRQGTNRDCIFIGRSLQISSDTNRQEGRIYTLVGKRQNGGVDSSSFTQASVRALSDFSVLKQSSKFTYGCMMYATQVLTTAADRPCTNPPLTPAPASSLVRTDVLTFMTTFVGLNPSTQNRDSGDTQVDLLVHNPSLPNNNGRARATVVGNLDQYGNSISPVVNPAGGIFICIDSTSSNQFGLLKLGGNSSKYSSDVTVSQGRCA